MIRHSSTAVAPALDAGERRRTRSARPCWASTSITFDVSVAEIFGTLCWGGTLVLVENALELPDVADQRIRYASMVPTAAAELLRSGGIPASVRTLNLGGEALPDDLARALYALGTVADGAQPLRAHGGHDATPPTPWSARGADRVLVGRPVANTRRVRAGRGAAAGARGRGGRAVPGGRGLARGYRRGRG